MSRYAISGVKSKFPNAGINRRSGPSIHSVSVYDQRIQREYGETRTHDETTRTMSASLSSRNPHDNRSRPNRDGELMPHITETKSPSRSWSRVMSTRPP